MKKILFALVLTLSTMMAYAQRGPANPRLTALNNEKDSLILNQKLAALYTSNEEADLTLLASYYSGKRNTKKAEEISKLVLQKFPNGLAAFNALFEEIYNENDANEKEKKFKAFMFKWSTPPAGARLANVDAARYYVATGFLGKNQPSKVLSYLNMIKDTTYKTNAFSYAAREAIGAKDYVLGEQLIRKTFADVERRTGAKPQGVQYAEYMRIFSLLLYHNGKYNEGFKYAQELENLPGQNELSKKTYKAIYLNYLLAMNQLKEAYPLMEEEFKAGNGNSEMRAKFKAAYIATKGSDKGYDELMKNVNTILDEKIRASLAKKMKSQPAFNFEMKDLSGKTVRLSDYKGKVVILDFWATWCGPCKASFPMMQKAVDKYKSDKDVVFLFIHTMETTSDAPKLAAAYIKEMKYTFNVLMDMKDPKTNTNPAAVGFRVGGIPTKFVIDKSGNIRFSTLGGGSAGEDEFLQEIGVMIEMAKG